MGPDKELFVIFSYPSIYTFVLGAKKNCLIGYRMGHAWVTTAVGTEWVTPGLPSMF